MSNEQCAKIKFGFRLSAFCAVRTAMAIEAPCVLVFGFWLRPRKTQAEPGSTSVAWAWEWEVRWRGCYFAVLVLVLYRLLSRQPQPLDAELNLTLTPLPPPVSEVSLPAQVHTAPGAVRTTRWRCHYPLVRTTYDIRDTHYPQRQSAIGPLRRSYLSTAA